MIWPFLCRTRLSHLCCDAREQVVPCKWTPRKLNRRASQKPHIPWNEGPSFTPTKGHQSKWVQCRLLHRARVFADELRVIAELLYIWGASWPLKKRRQPRNDWFFGTFIPAPLEQTFKLFSLGVPTSTFKILGAHDLRKTKGCFKGVENGRWCVDANLHIGVIAHLLYSESTLHIYLS